MMQKYENAQTRETTNDIIVHELTDENKSLTFVKEYLKSGFVSSAVDQLFYARRQADLTQAQVADRLFHYLSGLQAADGSPVVGEPERVLDYSEITAQFPYQLDAIFSKPVRRLLSKTIGIGAADKSMTIIPNLAIQAFHTGEVLAAVPSANDPHAFTFTLRPGTRPEEHIYFSGAPLRSEAHLAYLDELATSLKS